MKPLGKSGGVISTILIGSIFNVSDLIKTGDWARFGLSTGGTITSAAAGYAGAEGGAIIGTMIFPGVGTVIGGIVGGIAAGLFGGWVFNKISGSSEMTKIEK